MSRSRYKFPHFNKQIWKQNLNTVKFKRWFKFKNLYIFSKSCMILPIYDKRIVHIHKGKGFKIMRIDQNHFFKLFGDFILTRKPFFFPIKVKKKKK